MGKTTLVGPGIEEGREFLELLRQVGVPIKAALWQRDRLTKPELCQFGPVNVEPTELTGAVFGASANAVLLVWKRVVKGDDAFPDLRWHDLRHEAASRLFEKGLHPIEVAAITGHRSMQMLKRYTHLNPSDLLAKLG